MFRGGWLSVVALVGLTLLAGAGEPQKQPVDGGSSQQTQAVKPLPAPTASTETYSPYPKPDAGDCYYTKDHEAADLCAQWRAAIAAEKAAEAARFGNWIGGGAALLSLASLAGVLVALWQTRTALKLSRDEFTCARNEAAAFAQQSKDAVHHAAEAVKVAREQLVAEQRPWLSIKAKIAGPLRFVRDGEGKIQGLAEIEFTIANFGKSPAIAILVYAKIQPWRFSAYAPLQNEFVETLENRKQAPRLGVLLVPDDTHKETHSLPIWPRDIGIALAKSPFPGETRAIFPQVLVCVAYEDPNTGLTHESGGTFFLSRTQPATSSTIIPTDEGVIEAEHLKISPSITGWYVT